MKFAESHRRIFSTQVVSELLVLSSLACGKVDPTPSKGECVLPALRDKVEGVDYFLPKIELGNGKLSLPITKPSKLKHPAIHDYATNETLQNFRYNNSTDVRLEVILNENSPAVYADIHMQTWGALENYFKASNYFDLTVSH